MNGAELIVELEQRRKRARERLHSNPNTVEVVRVDRAIDSILKDVVELVREMGDVTHREVSEEREHRKAIRRREADMDKAFTWLGKGCGCRGGAGNISAKEA